MKWEDDPKATFGDLYDQAMTIRTEKGAAVYLLALCRWSGRYYKQSFEESRKIHLENIGYWTGYCDDETALRVQRIFNAPHPIFGFMKDGKPTPKEAFEAGQKLAAGLQKELVAHESITAIQDRAKARRAK